MPQTDISTTPPPYLAASRPQLRVLEKHSAAIRWMHWINFPLLSLMILSGFMIYWADSIPGDGLSGQAQMHRVYRIGFGSHTLIRLFPDSFYGILRLSHHFPQGIGMHALGMGLFTLNGVAYVVFLAISGQWRFILPFVRPPQTEHKYSPSQRIAYTLCLLMGAGSVLTGIAIWKPASLHLITALCGGYQTARWLHFWLTLAFCLFFAVHVAQVLRAGWNNLRSMIPGAELVPVHPPNLIELPSTSLTHPEQEAVL